MIGIQLDGDTEFLETQPDTAISITLENPIFGGPDKLSPGSFSLPFDLPAGRKSPSNAAKLKNPDVLENNEAYTLQKAKLFIGGVPFKSGNLKAKTSINDKVSAYFTFGLNSISEDFKKAKLRNVLSEDVVIGDDPIVKNIFVENLWTENIENHSIEINGQTYSDDSLSGLSVLINNYYDANTAPGIYLPRAELVAGPRLRIRMATTLIIIGFPTITDSTDPHIPLHVTIPADDRVNWEVEVFDMTDYYQEFIDYLDGYITGVYPDSKLRFPVMFNANLYEGEAVRDGEIINGLNSAGLILNDANFGFNNSQPLVVKNYNSIQPFVLVKHALDKIAEEFGFTYEGDFYDSLTTEPRLIDNATTLDLLMDFIGDNKFAFWRRSFNLNEFVPDITVVDFLKGLQSRYNPAVYYNEVTRNVRLQFREGIAKAIAYDDITGISSPVRGIDDLRVTGYLITVPAESNDAFSVDETKTIGVAQVDLTISCGRLQRTQSIVIDAGLVSGPYVSRKNGDSFGLRVFHYKELVDNGVFEYPGADLHGSATNESLNDFGDLYQTHWQYWLLFESNRLAVKLDVSYPLRRLLQLDWELKRRFDRSNYLIKSIGLTITNRNMKVTQVEVYTQK